VRIHQLQHFPLGDGIGRVGHDLLDAHVAQLDHHLECPGIQVIPDQHAGLVAEHVIGRVATPAPVRAIHDIVMQQRGGVDELDDCRGRYMLLTRMSAGPGRQHHAQRAQALAAAADDVLGDLVDQHDVAGQPPDDRVVHAAQVLGNGAADLF
jgi:hypothetical protein